MKPYRDFITGSVNFIQNIPKIFRVSFIYDTSITCNIEVAFANAYNLFGVGFSAAYSHYDYVTPTTSTNVYGNISVFGDKYNIGSIELDYYGNINGKLSDLKNLKKLYSFICRYSALSGVKTDLYNNGANVTTFYV